MTYDALVPVKRLTIAKERLSALLSLAERVALARAMFRDVAETLLSAASISRVWIVSDDDEVLLLARRLGAMALVDRSNGRGLNHALEAARAEILSADPVLQGLLVVPADLPCLDEAALQEFLVGVTPGSQVRICPAPDGGTNALLLQPPDAIPFRFGRDSARQHERAAAAVGISPERCPVTALQIDVDRPADLARCLAGGCGSYTTAALQALEIARRLCGEVMPTPVCTRRL